jgi:hypothetical protein
MVALAATTAASTQTGAGSAPPPVWDTVTTDLVIRQGRISADGKPIGVPPPAMVLALERRHILGRFTTTIRLKEAEGATVQSPRGAEVLGNPFGVTRLELAEGEPPRYYNAAGQQVAAVSEADRARLGLPAALRDPNWDPSTLLARIPAAPAASGVRSVATGLLLRADEQAQRRVGLEKRFGQAVGQVRGLDRFVRRDGDAVHELLVRTDADLPVEVNIGINGQLVSRAEFTYESQPGVGFVRRRMRAEQLIPKGDGARTVTDVEFTNVAFSTRGNR